MISVILHFTIWVMLMMGALGLLLGRLCIDTLAITCVEQVCTVGLRVLY